MIKAKINGKSYEIKTNWSDLTFGEWLGIVGCKSELDMISLLTSIPTHDILKLDEISQQKLAGCLEFLKDVEADDVTCIDIKEATFGQKILLQQKLGVDNKDILPAFALVVYEYDYDNFNKSLNFVLELPFKFVYSKGVNYLNQLSEILEMEAEQLKAEISSDQKRAGIDMFDEFGAMNTINALAGGDVLKYDDVLKLDYNTVFVKLKMSKTERIFQENYSKIISKKK